MSRSSEGSYYFSGFDTPNGTVVPDVFFDELAPHLTEAELRCCLYIMRRTFGFKKNADTISLKQLVQGIKRKDGSTLDSGTGMAMTSVLRGLRGLEAKGVITSVRHSSDDKGDEPTTYVLRFNRHPASVEIAGEGAQSYTGATAHSETPPLAQSNPQQTGDTTNSYTSDAPPSQEKKSGVVDLWATVLNANRLGVPEGLVSRIRATTVSIGAADGYLRLVVRSNTDAEWTTRQVGKRLDVAIREEGLAGIRIEAAP